MSNAGKDGNNRPTIICASKNDGITIVQITADPSTHVLNMVSGTSQTDNGNNNGVAMLDENGVPVWTALSSADGQSLVEVYGDPATGSVLISNL